MNKTKISKEAPEWFSVVNDQKIKEFNDYLVKNEDTLSVFSRYQKWITVTPKSKNRKRPLEKQKVESMERTSKIMPKWMQNKFASKKSHTPDNLRTIEYASMKTKNRMMVWVDKAINPSKHNRMETKENKSIFSVGDCRHNVPYKNLADEYSSKVSQSPKVFFCWDDGTKFNPKLKKDI